MLFIAIPIIDKNNSKVGELEKLLEYKDIRKLIIITHLADYQ
jgi:hypothetical protein